MKYRTREANLNDIQITSQKSEQIFISTTTGGNEHCWKSFPNIDLGFALSMETLLTVSFKEVTYFAIHIFFMSENTCLKTL